MPATEHSGYLRGRRGLADGRCLWSQRLGHSRPNTVTKRRAERMARTLGSFTVGGAPLVAGFMEKNIWVPNFSDGHAE